MKIELTEAFMRSKIVSEYPVNEFMKSTSLLQTYW